MYSKGPSPVTHSAPGDHAPQIHTSRRSLLGVGVGASILATALASLNGTNVGALQSSSGIEEDRELMKLAMSLELTARDLYDQAATAGADATVTKAMREQHESYAQSLAGASGGSANGRNEAVFNQFRRGFASSDTAALARVAYVLESAAVATHTELLGLLSEASSARLIASIISVEARHCAVLADLAGLGNNLDALLVNSADPISFEEQ
jgi:rubrerythrin